MSENLFEQREASAPDRLIAAPASAPVLSVVFRALAWSVVAWTVVTAAHAFAAYSDQLRRGQQPEFVRVLADYGLAYLPWVLLSTGLYVEFTRNAVRVADPRFVGSRLLLSLVAFYLPQEAYQMWMARPANGPSFLTFASRWPVGYWLGDLLVLVATFAAVYGIVALRTNLLAERSRARVAAENLALRLEVEHQRLQNLRAQLEPHFVFNALNAISGLVRGDDRPLALTAIGQLSSLLRYALTASSREWVTVADELAFVGEYLGLQHLRYGDRLRVTITGADANARAADCPPLLLQPLIENAIRHDLERQDGPSDIRLSFTPDAAQLIIHLSNAAHADAPENPGLGLGLQATRDRLALAYRGRAMFASGITADRFVVTLRIPAVAND